MPKKIVNHEVWKKIFCSVAIMFASPKVSVTASKSKQVPRREKNGVLGVPKFISNQLLAVLVHIYIYMYIYTYI